MTEIKKPNHHNIFDSDIIQDIFVLDIFEKLHMTGKEHME